MENFGYLFKGAHLYTPEDIGVKDCLVINNKIIEINDTIKDVPSFVEVIQADGLKMTPGFIDQHVHTLGGGGEGGLSSRVPDVKISEIIASGITSLVGILGTDGVTKNIESLVAKTKELKHYGFTSYCLTGSYDYPSITLTGDVRKDIVFIEEMIGCKLAISDHRAPQVTKSELLRLASQIRTARLLSGKNAYLKLHIGSSKERLSMLNDILHETDIPIDIFRPTHVGRTKELLNEAILFAKNGGIIDFTARPNKEFLENVSSVLSHGVSNSNITFSSDGMGSWSTYKNGELDKIGYSPMNALLMTVKYLDKENVLPLEELLSFVTRNVAKALGLKNKGTISIGKDADILLLNDVFDVVYMFSNGKQMMNNKTVEVMGYYE